MPINFKEGDDWVEIWSGIVNYYEPDEEGETSGWVDISIRDEPLESDPRYFRRWIEIRPSIADLTPEAQAAIKSAGFTNDLDLSWDIDSADSFYCIHPHIFER